MATQLAESRHVPIGQADAFDRLIALPLPALFSHWHGPFPPIRETREAPPVWGSVGQTRRIVLADGATALETLTSVDRPRSFGYTLTELTGALRLVVELVEGRWSVGEAAAGSVITWEWAVHPRGRIGAVMTPALSRFWHGYARKGLEQLEHSLAGS